MLSFLLSTCADLKKSKKINPVVVKKKRHFHPERVSFHLSFSCLVSMCADSKSHISICCAWKERHFSLKKIFSPRKRLSIHLSIPCVVSVCVLIQNHILAHACAGKERHLSSKKTFTPR